MATAAQRKANKVDATLREEWLRTVDALASQIADWVRQEPEWSFEAEETLEVEEPLLGRYTVTVWSIHTPEGEVHLEPKARNFPGRGMVELYAWPTLRRVYLLPGDIPEEWKVLTDSGIFLRQNWARPDFVLLVQDLIHA